MAKMFNEGAGKTVLGIDIGSTTAKFALLVDGELKYTVYERHFSDVQRKVTEMLRRISEFVDGEKIHIAVSGSAGMGLSERYGLPFMQEVYVTSKLIRRTVPEAEAVIELGGEDAKIIFLKGGCDARMNGSCAGGTGAFIDQMATLLSLEPEEMDKISLEAEKIYPIASRCGVFAKSDIQSLLNQGATKGDIAASVYQSVVNQTISGLAQGTPITGKVVFLGGPLYYNKGLRGRFKETLKLSEENAIFPEYGRYSVALGAALSALEGDFTIEYNKLLEKIEAPNESVFEFEHTEPLFKNKDEYLKFCERHSRAVARYNDIDTYSGDAYLGIDCGSTTTKLALIDEDNKILYEYYCSNKGNPVNIVHEELIKIRELCKERINIAGSAVTGYGEELICHAFHVDSGIVETMAHLSAAKYFSPEVDFILDIGGQDIKCFKIKNGAVDSIMLNEACSSGCGSFLETFARGLGMSAPEFAVRGLYAKAPAQLGTRCTVFMNSSVKQAQKDGASVEDISAGLSVSVVKNALYKVIRTSSASELGENIVVQGGTFYNDSVLRSFEREIGKDVIRPQIAGLMGAFGAALYAKTLGLSKSGLLSKEELEAFDHISKATVCKGCSNSCNLTVNTFSSGEKYISGNRCEKGSGVKASSDAGNLYEYKRQFISGLSRANKGSKIIGIPLALQMYDSAPMWHGIFTSLGFDVVFSGMSTKDIYYKGQYTIPSDTVCYPAKLMHGHVEKLIEDGIENIFYPSCTYNFEEKMTDNHYNCPVVAYYSELLSSNVPSLKKVNFMYPYLDMSSPARLTYGMHSFLKEQGYKFTKNEIKNAVLNGISKYKEYREAVVKEGNRIVNEAREQKRRILVLAGRPYHVDSEINHGIDTLAVSLGFSVISEDALCEGEFNIKPNVLNQWTYHSRLYKAAEAVIKSDDMYYCQLVSFGCGLDAVTTDEIREMLESHGKLYTQLKIDEITNLGAVKIRLRSLIGAIDEKLGGH